MTKLPNKAKVVIIGGGIHGLSTAWKLSETYKNPGDIIVLEKNDIAAGASGIACGVVRNNYFQPAMRELMAHSVSVWESDPKAFKYNAVGYLQISPEVMHEDVATIYEQQKAIGYESEFIEGEKDCTNYMRECLMIGRLKVSHQFFMKKKVVTHLTKTQLKLLKTNLLLMVFK